MRSRARTPRSMRITSVVTSQPVRSAVRLQRRRRRPRRALHVYATTTSWEWCRWTKVSQFMPVRAAAHVASFSRISKECAPIVRHTRARRRRRAPHVMFARLDTSCDTPPTWLLRIRASVALLGCTAAGTPRCALSPSCKGTGVLRTVRHGLRNASYWQVSLRMARTALLFAKAENLRSLVCQAIQGHFVRSATSQTHILMPEPAAALTAPTKSNGSASCLASSWRA
mmetsp:Transcript_12907/g.32188  ORF Transcript_12907/g.32188 Transcript_12907/m.32188 type:complete len:227 (+) Transcript_12907:1152-1832(+)